MSGHVELEQAARLHLAEKRWLDQCADRLRKASSPQGASAEPDEADGPEEPVEPAGTTTTTEPGR